MNPKASLNAADPEIERDLLRVEAHVDEEIEMAAQADDVQEK